MVHFSDIEAAAKRLERVAVKTPLLENMRLNDITGGTILIKPETLQHIGAFKFRGAYNRLVQLTDDEKSRGVVAFSSGNHAQGVAAAAKLLGISATIVMPEDAPQMKADNTKKLGATVRFYDRYTENREEISAEIAAATGAIIVPSFNDPHIIAGQGTAGLEMMKAAKARDLTPDAVIIPCGGGGLSSGVCLAVKHLNPETDCHIVEPQAFNDAHSSLSAGTIIANPTGGRSICDALQSPSLGSLTFPILKTHVSNSHSVTDEETLKAMRFAFEELKLVVEPGGAVALAALLTGKIDTKGKTTAIILSGGNVDPATFQLAFA